MPLEAAPAYRILTSREVLVGPDGLDGINTNPLNQGAVVLAAGALYRLDRNSSAVADGLTVVQPAAGPGRWLFLAAPGGAYVSVASITSLAALGASSPDLVWVETVKCYWRRNAASTLAPDGITVVAAVGGGNWERMVSTTAPDWLAQAAWTLDPVAGNDENAGGSAAPLATAAELNRRLSVGTLQQETTLTIPAGATVPVIDLTIDPGIYRFVINGEPTVLYSGIVNTFTERVHSGALPQSALLTDAGVADWTPHLNRRVRVTSGASTGAVSWILKANPNGLGLGVARMGRFTAPIASPLESPIIANPSPGDQYVIESLPVVRTLSVVKRQATALSLPPAANGSESFRVSSLTVQGDYGTVLRLTVEDPRGWVVDGCSIDAFLSTENTGAIAHHRIGRSLLGGTVYPAGLFCYGGGYSLTGCASIRYVRFATAESVRLRYHTGQGYAIVTQATAFSAIAGIYLNDSQVFDAAYGVHLQNVCFVHSEMGLSGQGNTVGMKVGDSQEKALFPQCFSWSQATDAPNLLGTTEVQVVCASGNINLTWATIFAEGGFDSDSQYGVATLQNGTRTVTGVRNPDRRHPIVSRDTPSGNPIGTELAVPTAGCTPSQFVINALDATGAVVATDQSTVRWQIPPMRRKIVIAQGSANA